MTPEACGSFLGDTVLLWTVYNVSVRRLEHLPSSIYFARTPDALSGDAFAGSTSELRGKDVFGHRTCTGEVSRLITCLDTAYH